MFCARSLVYSVPRKCYSILFQTKTSWLNGRHVVFGKVLEGMNVVREIENTKTQAGDRPVDDVVIENCGELPLDAPFDTDKAAVSE